MDYAPHNSKNSYCVSALIKWGRFGSKSRSTHGWNDNERHL